MLKENILGSTKTVTKRIPGQKLFWSRFSPGLVCSLDFQEDIMSAIFIVVIISLIIRQQNAGKSSIFHVKRRIDNYFFLFSFIL